jgi:hypothetical protein
MPLVSEPPRINAAETTAPKTVWFALSPNWDNNKQPDGAAWNCGWDASLKAKRMVPLWASAG